MTRPDAAVDAASDEVVYGFMKPASILDANSDRLPRTSAAVQAVFTARRALSQQALTAYNTRP